MFGDVVGMDQIDGAQVASVGGKGAALGELARLDGVRVPPGFCVTTAAFERVRAGVPHLAELLDRLSRPERDDRAAIGTVAGEIRRILEAAPVPDDLVAAIAGALAGLGEQAAVAVRSSATAEDAPGASFAGLHDSYLNVVGLPAVLHHVRRCWASLFTDRAVAYRRRNGLDHAEARMAVVVQQMVAADVAGVLFTADPVTSNRRVVAVEASFGLGEAVVAGLVQPDVVRVRDGVVVSRDVATKRVAVRALPGGGTQADPVDAARREQPALTDAQALELERLGRRIEAHFGRPQDVEWCLDGDGFVVVQSRPITALFPVPEADDGRFHVYVSVGHQQMMTDAMKPLGLSLFQLTALRPMQEAGGRLFVDVTDVLASPAARGGLLEMLGRSDPLIRDALGSIIDRGDVVQSPAETSPGVRPAGGVPPAGPAPEPIEADPALVAALIRRSEESLDALRSRLQGVSGAALVDAVVDDIGELKRLMFDESSAQVIMAGMQAAWWLNDHVEAWLGEKNVADVLSRSVPGNVTSEMGLALLDVADVIRPHPEVVAFLERVEGGEQGDDDFLDALAALDGGAEARDAIGAFLDAYGMRCVGEIDITRPRWAERPSTLVPVILGHVRNAEPGAAGRRVEQGRREATAKAAEVLERLRALPDGERKADEAARMIERLRTFAGYREYPKYVIVSRYFVSKQALLAEAERLSRAGVLRDPEDAFFLTLPELGDALRTDRVDQRLIGERREAFRAHQALTPPRVLTSDGECVAGAYRRDDLPPGALAGLAVSAGLVEGRARVLHDLGEAELEPGDILVTTYTDPSWSPLFLAAAGLVTEVGGLMTHGAVIAREYGLPAVVGVVDATRRIADGQRIRLHGTDGYVEVLP